MGKICCTAIVLAAGKGKRMGAKIQKQYLMLKGKPVLYYSLKAFQDSPLIDEIYLVVGAGEEAFCKSEVINKYGIAKVKKIIAGGKERYHSVWNGLQEVGGEGYTFIHDGARPLVDGTIIERALSEVKRYKACVVGMPVKDTIKISDKDGMAKRTPDRRNLWMVQTPQVFDNQLIKKAYSLQMGEPYINVTDDAMVVERMLKYPVKLVLGSYENIKITTPEDLEIAEVFLRRKE